MILSLSALHFLNKVLYTPVQLSLVVNQMKHSQNTILISGFNRMECLHNEDTSTIVSMCCDYKAITERLWSNLWLKNF